MLPVPQAGPKLSIELGMTLNLTLLFLLPQCWDYKPVPSRYFVLCVVGNQAQVPLHARQEIHQLSHLSRPLNRNVLNNINITTTNGKLKYETAFGVYKSLATYCVFPTYYEVGKPTKEHPHGLQSTENGGDVVNTTGLRNLRNRKQFLPSALFGLTV